MSKKKQTPPADLAAVDQALGLADTAADDNEQMELTPQNDLRRYRVVAQLATPSGAADMVVEARDPEDAIQVWRKRSGFLGAIGGPVTATLVD